MNSSKSLIPLHLAVNKLGDRMADCKACRSDPYANIDPVRPRGLILERRRNRGSGCIVAGINPGRPLRNERLYYQRKPDAKYQSQVAFFKSVKGSYYKNLYKLLRALNLAGPVLWTDVVKCETPRGKALPNELVVQRCVDRFLKQELELAPSVWPVIAAGKDAFCAMQRFARGRVVIGVPHPSARFTKHLFNLLLKPPGRRLLNEGLRAIRAQKGKQIWLNARQSRTRRLGPRCSSQGAYISASSRSTVGGRRGELGVRLRTSPPRSVTESGNGHG